MRVAVLSSPMLFQAQGGLQIQILETNAALQRRGVDARLIDPNVEHLKSFDLVHVYSVINGNHRIAEYGKTFGLPVVTSPLIRPHWNRSLGKRARLMERVVGRLTHWDVKTEYRQIESCLSNSDILIALGEIERRSMVDAFKIDPKRIRVIPNGIPKRFFDASPTLAMERLEGKNGFVLCVAAINPHKNQLGLVQALAGTNRHVVLAGECLPSEEPYLQQIQSYPHVTYLGKLDYDDPLLASAYAAAGVFCLPSQSEVMPLSILESLATGTPVVTTQNHSMDMKGLAGLVREVNPNDLTEIRSMIEAMLNAPPSREKCCAAVRDLTWDAVAEAVHQCYLDAMNGHTSKPDLGRK